MMTLRVGRNLSTVAVKPDMSKVKQKKELIEIYKKAGSKCKLIGSSHLPCVKNVGFAEKRFQKDGCEIVTVYPSAPFRKYPL